MRHIYIDEKGLGLFDLRITTDTAVLYEVKNIPLPNAYNIIVEKLKKKKEKRPA